VANVIVLDDVVAKPFHVRGAEFDRLWRESGFEVFGEDVGKL
jgi:hypothetical protein